MAALVATAPASSAVPAWVVGAEYGRVVHVWDHDGIALGDVPWPGGQMLGVVDWPDARVLVAADTALEGIGLDGGVRFTLPHPGP